MLRSMVERIRANIALHGVAFLACGIANTLFGYFGSVALFELMKGWLDTAVVLVLIRIVTITFSYLTYKLFVFKTKRNWIREYFRCYITYGFTSIVIMAALWIMVELLHIPFWLAQLGATAFGVVLNFIGHSCFTFAPSSDRTLKEKS